MKKKRISTKEEFYEILKKISGVNKIQTNKKILYYNIPCSFDIETSSFYNPSQLGTDEKVAIMYEWTFAMYGYIIVGRTWDEFIELYNHLVDILKLDINNRLIVYVHNLSFEFQFIRKRLDWEKVFSLTERKPVQAITCDGIEFRCSYKLSGYSLAKLGDQLTKYIVHKDVGDLNYDLIRTPTTPLTEQEWNYCVDDVLVVVCYIQELIEREGDITKIPLTKTGFVRRFCRNKCLYENDDKYHKKYKKYRELMKSLTLDVETYDQLKRAFAGGFTHASPLYAFDTCHNVGSFDFTSSYPYVMVSEKFPMTKFQKVAINSREDRKYYINNYCCLFDIEIFNLQPRVYFENYISKSHCYELKNPILNNGRIVSADHLKITITDVDFNIIKKFYKWSKIRYFNFKIANRGYLPTDLIKAVLEMYQKKTTLKGIEGFEIEYLKSKEDINATFGMCVTDICRDDIQYISEWKKIEADKEKAISTYNKSVKRFLSYAWGVWITAYARANLFTGIWECKYDYLYADTDSIKILNSQNHIKYFEKYNNMVGYKLQQAANYHGFNISLTAPKTKSGKIKQLGVWDSEGTYNKFKSLGAKRYIYEKDNHITMTVAGLNKQNAVKYIQSRYDDIFNAFTNNLYIPAKYLQDGKYISGTGKQTHTYIDECRRGVVKDYLGNYYEYEELSAIHLEGADYDFSINQEYIDYVLGIKEEIIE